MSLVIRGAGPADIGVVFALIRELADYEKLSHEVVATEADIAAALFCENPTLFCDIAEWNGEVAGFAVWFVNFSTFAGRPGIYLEDLFVRPAFRRNGIGQALLEGAVYDDTGQLVTASFMDYTMPRADDLPSFQLSHTTTLCPGNPLGIKGCGEAGAIGASAAVINAITDAIGKNNLEMPATPDRVWRTIHAA